MLSTEITIELKMVESGTPVTFRVKKMTLAHKCNLDQWLRMQYVHNAIKADIPLKDAEQEAAYLDIVNNCWFLPDQRRMARVLYELTSPKMSFSEFEDKFFSTKFSSMAAIGADGVFPPEVENLKYNNEQFATAFEFAATNPTTPPKKETPKEGATDENPQAKEPESTPN